MRIPIGGMIVALLFATPVAAQERVDRGNGLYFNRPGATAQAMTADLAQCRAIAEGADSQITGIAVVTAGLGGVLGGLIAGGRLKRVNTENCMLIRGWRLYAMTRTQGAAWKALSDDAREARLTTLVGAENPDQGALLRVWANDYAEPVLWQKD